MQAPVFYDHTTSVPLDWQGSSSAQIELFAREVYLPKNKKKDIFLFLQGGPGFASPRDPMQYPWFVELIKHFRIVLLDQRGTGRSQKIGPELAEKNSSDDAIAHYFRCHGPRSIIEDLEYLRKNVFKVDQWFLIGQSYGGFLSFCYLSYFPDSIKGALVTGGVPPLLEGSVDAIYKKLVSVIHKRNMEFYKTYPKDADQVRRIIDLLQETPVRFTDGNSLSVDRFRLMGLEILGGSRPLDTMHWFLEDPFLDSGKKRLSYAFIANCMKSRLHFDTNPIYAVLHESIYCQNNSSNWAAERQLQAHGGFGLNEKRIAFFGETIKQSLFDDIAALTPFKKAAQQIARHTWGETYDLSQLKQNKVPVECYVFKGDYYVDYDFSMDVLTYVKKARGTVHKTWQHDALRKHGKEIVTTLLPKLLKRVR